jgi:hypothetical protein
MSEFKKHKYLFASIISLSLVSLALSILILTDYQGGDIFESNLSLFKAKQSTNKSVETISKLYVNKKGQEWYLPQGIYKFKSSSSKNNLSFLEGEINPIDANVGEVQKFSIIVQSPVGIKNVKVRIERDNSIKELNLVKAHNVSYFDTVKELFISQVVAQSGEKEKWEGDWLVEDTTNNTYRTTFIAEDDLGATNSFILTWSDPCEIPANGLPLGGSGGTWELEQDCTILSGGVDGIENGNVLIDRGNTIFIQGTFVFNPNYQIDIVDGNIIIGTSSGGQIRKTNMWYCDKDGDRRTPSGSIGTILTGLTAPTSACGGGGGGGSGTFNNLYKRVVNLFNFTTPKAAAEENCGPTEPAWAIRRYLFIEGQLDCYEGSSNVYQGSNGFCETPRGRSSDDPNHPSWDYNCDNNEQKESEVVVYDSSCRQNPDSGCFTSCHNAALKPFGWKDFVPDCGQESIYVNNCTNVSSIDNCGLWSGEECRIICENPPYNCLVSQATGTTRKQKCQ